MAEVVVAGSQFASPSQGRPPLAAPTAPATLGSHPTNGSLEWRRSHGLVDYARATAEMEARAQALAEGSAAELVWLLEHPPLLTAGTSAKPADLLDPTRFPVHQTGRGGKFTYHGPGQRVVYAVLDLKRRRQDLRWYVHSLEEWVIRTLAVVGVRGERRLGRIGIWVVLPDGSERKIGAIGVRVRRWVAYHGIAINVAPDLGHFQAIVPCGIAEHGVTSLAQLGIGAGMAEVDAALAAAWEDLLAPTRLAERACSVGDAR
jgi:lipoyl(octanoyl) transferase